LRGRSLAPTGDLSGEDLGNVDLIDGDLMDERPTLFYNRPI
jgi:hypothetical protein